MLRMANLHGTKPPPSEGSDEEEEEDDEEDEEERKPSAGAGYVPHYGGINRVCKCSPRSLPCVLLELTTPTRPCLSSKKSLWHIVFEISYVLIVIVVTMS